MWNIFHVSYKRGIYIYICVYIHNNQTDYLTQKLICGEAHKWRKIYKIPTGKFFINTVKKIINYKPYFRDV